jgi:succinate-semialdehyde dehydrogenase/glutarate-semialdehyde dehydrogenase
MKSINPSNGELIAEYAAHDDAEVESALERAANAARSWPQASWTDRTAVLTRCAQLLRSRVDELAALMTTEMGKPLAQAEGEVHKCAWVCEYYAEHAERFLESVAIETDASRSYVRFDALGPILAIMPWNFPLWQVFRFAAPNLAAGNVGLLKHAANVCGCALAIEELFREAGAPEGVFQTLLIDHDQTDAVMRDRRVRGITLTGSVRAGRVVASVAGECIKPTVLELGGSDPFIVLADCDLQKTLNGAIAGRTQNNGQSCIAAKRFIVERGILEEFTDAFVDRMEALVIGDPMDRATDIGPLARPEFVDDIHDQCRRTQHVGGRYRTGGVTLDGPGYFYPPTVMTHVTPGMPLFDEETFAPVAAVIEAKDLDHAIELANNSTLGLGASVWTTRTEGLDEIASRIESGHVAFNGIVKSDPRLPFGGIKDSGYGRELSRHGLLEFLNRKTVWVG